MAETAGKSKTGVVILVLLVVAVLAVVVYWRLAPGEVVSPGLHCMNLSLLDRYECLTSSAVNESNAGVCDLLNDTVFRDNCVYRYALFSGDGEACTSISGDENLVMLCFMQVGSNPDYGHPEWGELSKVPPQPEYCSRILGNYSSRRDKCFADAACVLGNSSLCVSVSEDDMRLYCQATLSGDVSVCGGIVHSSHKDLCIEGVNGGSCLFTWQQWTT